MNNYFFIDRLEVKAGNFQLGPVSLEMEKGDYLTLLGPTGCGKTTLAKTIAGFYGNFPGKIFFGDGDIGILPAHRRKIGFVTQTSDLFPHLSVKQNIAFGLKYLNLSKTEMKKRTGRYLELFRLNHLSEREPGRLSGGETRRVAIARSLIVEPMILLLDEPLGMIDYNGRKDVLQVLKDIHENINTTAIHITHDRYEVWKISASCAVMDNGKIIQTGAVAELFRKPKTRFVAEFLGCENIIKTEKGFEILRPEEIQIMKNKLKAKASGIIQSITDFGEYIEILVKTEEGNVLTVHSFPRENNYSRGDKIYLYWDEMSKHIIREE